MEQSAAVNFLDPHEGKAAAIVRSTHGTIGIALSIEKNGDIEVFMPLADAEKFSRALIAIINSAKGLD